MRAQQLQTGYYAPATTNGNGMGDMITSIMPIMMLAMVFAMIIPMFKGITGEMGR